MDIQKYSHLCACVPGKRYNLADVSAALCMSLGLIWFTLADSKVAPSFNLTGTFFSIQQQTTAVSQKCCSASSDETTFSSYIIMVSLSLLKGMGFFFSYAYIFAVKPTVFSLYSFSWNTWFVFSHPCFIYLCVFGTQVFSSSPWRCAQMQPLETCRRKPWNSIMAPTLKWYFVDKYIKNKKKKLKKRERDCICIGNWSCLQNSEGIAEKNVFALRIVFCLMSLTGLCWQVLYSYSIGFVYILTGLLCVGGLGPAVAFCSEVSSPEDSRARYPWHFMWPPTDWYHHRGCWLYASAATLQGAYTPPKSIVKHAEQSVMYIMMIKDVRD